MALTIDNNRRGQSCYVAAGRACEEPAALPDSVTRVLRNPPEITGQYSRWTDDIAKEKHKNMPRRLERDLEKRRLVGRRYEDYIRNDIHINLTPEERTWRMLISDIRYHSLVERRRGARRAGDRPLQRQYDICKPGCSFILLATELKR